MKNKENFFEKPVYLVDNHNKAIFVFFEVIDIFEKLENNFGKKEKINIVHIDAHRDDAIFKEKYPEKIDKENINSMIEKTKVSDYLDLATKTGLIGKVLNITQSYEFEEFCENDNFIIKSQKKTKKKTIIALKNPYILNLDIDIFGFEGEMVDVELKIKTIKKAWDNAMAVVVATSPGYIKQEKAQKIIEIFMNNK